MTMTRKISRECTARAVRLKRLLIHRYRNVRRETELRFDDEWNVLLGKNGTGKTTLLRLLEALLNGDWERLGRNALDVEYDIECGPARISGRIRWYCGDWTPPVDGNCGPSLIPFDLRVAGTMSLKGAPDVTWDYAAPGDTFNVRLGEEALPFRSGSVLGSYASACPFGAWSALGHETRYGPPLLDLQRRLMELGWLVDARRLDESLEYFSARLGWHRDWLDAAVKKMRGRQNFVAAQNSLLLDRIGFENEEQMRRSFVFCREEDGEFVWENAGPEDIHEVFRAYEVGLQNVSEILWQKGLW